MADLTAQDQKDLETVFHICFRRLQHYVNGTNPSRSDAIKLKSDLEFLRSTLDGLLAKLEHA